MEFFWPLIFWGCVSISSQSLGTLKRARVLHRTGVHYLLLNSRKTVVFCICLRNIFLCGGNISCSWDVPVCIKRLSFIWHALMVALICLWKTWRYDGLGCWNCSNANPMDVSCKICLNMRSIIFVFSLFRFLWAGLWVKQRLSPISSGFWTLGPVCGTACGNCESFRR